MVTAHYGNWEILGYTLATLGFETYSVARPIDNPHIDAWLLGVREKKGQVILSKRGVTTTALDVLEKRGVLGFIADQNAGPKGMFVPFFGRLASTYKSIGLLAIQNDLPIVVGYAPAAETSLNSISELRTSSIRKIGKIIHAISSTMSFIT